MYLALWQAAAAAAAALVSQYSTKAVPLGCWLALFITSLYSTQYVHIVGPSCVDSHGHDALHHQEAGRWQCANLKQLYLQVHNSRIPSGIMLAVASNTRV